MLREIEFTDKRFQKEEDYNLLSSMTNNTIILCNNYKLMDSLAKEIFNTVNGNAEYNVYDCDDEDIGNAKMMLSFGLQRVIDIKGQRITLSLEPAIIYKADNIDDVWLFDWNGNDELGVCAYQEFIYPLGIFKGSHEVWKGGKDELYKMICNGRYGTYDGKWIDLSGDHCKDDRVINGISESKNSKA